MKGIVTDLVVGTHTKNGVARGPDSATVDLVVGESSGFALSRMVVPGSQMRGEFLPDCFCDR